MSLHAIILAGGSGTRFWPLSRAKKPKQFLKLVTGNALIAETFARVEQLVPKERAWVVCGRDHAEGVHECLPMLPQSHIVVEPAARNTAPAIGLAAVHALHEDKDALLVVLPSDHHIAFPERFRESLQVAAAVAETGQLVTLGIKPTRPETGYGYLKRGAAQANAFAVEAFVEKPELKTAERYLAEGTYLWNAGIFLFRADAILKAFAQHLPDMHKGLMTIGEALARGDGDAVSREVFPRLAGISIDYGVMEPESKAGAKISLVPGDFGWSDVGSFAALPEVRPLDARGNAVGGDAIAIDCDDCVVLGEGGRFVAALGLHGVCVVDAGDALLVIPRERAQDVRQVVDALKSQGRGNLL
ncbi:MAG: mannose-1-phosphate guanylyltransferase [Deltaproteobacteria bacterium]|nr:mannose-1-phosphate guanylyltransferase [Deltaproteobacteria bacterium]